MATSIPDVLFSGETVVIDPAAGSVSRGKFYLENRKASVFQAAVNVAWLEFGSGRQVLLSDLTVYDLDQGLPLNPERLSLGAQAVLPFEIAFADAAYKPAMGECTAVGLRLESDGVLLEALSPVEFAHRAG